MEEDYNVRRLIALFASVFVSLAAGTPYLYGVYSPQLVQRVELSTSDAATISVAMMIGAGSGGLPGGVLIDRAGPLVAILVGSICIFLGYFFLNLIWVHRIQNLVFICLAMVLVGFGSVTSFFAGIKTAQANFSNHRGTAGALPIGAYGLAATPFSIIAAKFFDGRSGNLLAFLAYFCGSIAFIGSWFVHVYPKPASSNLDAAPSLPGSNAEKASILNRTPSLSESFYFRGIGSGLSEPSFAKLSTGDGPLENVSGTQVPMYSFAKDLQVVLGCERSSIYDSPHEAAPVLKNLEPSLSYDLHKGSLAVIRDLLCDKTYMAHFWILSLCSGICQMYIYTVGFIVTAQFENNGLEGSPTNLQVLQVSTISLASFGGRISGGVIADFLNKTLKAQRQWVVVGSIFITFVSQLLVLQSNTINSVYFASLFIGSAYGLLYGSYPAIIADHCGTDHFSTAWGLGACGPIVVLFTLQKVFGSIYDNHLSDGVCVDGNKCYEGAFILSSFLCILAALITGVLMYKKRSREGC